MKLSPAPLTACFVAGLLLLLVPSAAAVTVGSIEANEAVVPSAEHEASADLVWIRLNGPDHFDFQLGSAAFTGAVHEDRTVVTEPLPPTIVTGPLEPTTGIPEQSDTPLGSQQMALRIVALGDEPRIAIAGEDAMALRATGLSAGLLPLDGAFFSPTDGVVSDEENPSDGTENRINFWTRSYDDMFTLAKVDGPIASISLQGSAMFEFFDVDLEIITPEGTRTLTSIPRYETFHSVMPGGSEAPVRKRVDSMIRLEVTDFTLEAETAFQDGMVQWLARGQSTVYPDGAVTFLGATGELLGPDGSLTFDGGPAHVTDLERMVIRPVDDALMQVDAVESANEPSPDSMFASLPDAWGQGAAWGLVGAVVFAMVLGGGAYARTPSIHKVEAAIGDGRFRRAARMAQRILRRQPDEERAAVARAVALSRSGRHDQVIDEVRGRVQGSAHTGPEDGVLHFLLGVSQWRTGAKAQALISFNEAVARTPSLDGEVAQYVGARKSLAGGYA